MTTFCERAISSDLRLEVQTVLRLCEIIDTPRSLSVYLLVQAGEWGQVTDLSIDASMYEDPQHFAGDYLITEVLKKSPNLPLGVDKAGRALQAFYDAELQCKHSNQRFFDEAHPEWVFKFRQNIGQILGPFTRETGNRILDRARFGPGASTGVRGVGSVPSDKFDKPLHMTASLYPFFRAIVGDLWWEHQKEPKVVVEGNKFTTVPKNAKTDRGICVEPTLNMFVQLGLGAHIRSRLKRFQVDLDDQTNNQELAERAYADGLATIDLAQASDSVSWGLIFHFFPLLWQELIFLLRSEFTLLPDGSIVELEKLSSMGNGFTFELESLIFYSVVKTIVPRDRLEDCGVYGDDIIVPTEYALEVIDALNFLGFSVNGSKSFLAGNFFESCGADYFRGLKVRPFYLRGSADSNIPYSLQIANSLRSYAHQAGAEMFCDSRYRTLWVWLIRQVPIEWRRLRVPPGWGDCGITSSHLETGYLARPKGGAEGRLVRYRIVKGRNLTKHSMGVYFSILARTSGVVRQPWELLPGPPDPPRVAFTKGREAIRGLYGRAVTKRAILVEWPCGWDWG